MPAGGTRRERRYLSLCGDAVGLATAVFGDVRWELSGSLSLYYWLEQPLRLPGDVDLTVQLEVGVPELTNLLQSVRSEFSIERVERVRFDGVVEPPPPVFQASLVRRSADGSIDDVVLLQATTVDRLSGAVWRRTAADQALPEAPVPHLETIVAEKALRCCEVRTPGGTPARWQDAVDLVAIATSGTQPLELQSVASEMSRLAERRGIYIDSHVSVQRGWTRVLDQYSYRFDLPWRGLDAWQEILRAFLHPLIRGDQGRAVWRSWDRSWRRLDGSGDALGHR